MSTERTGMSVRAGHGPAGKQLPRKGPGVLMNTKSYMSQESALTAKRPNGMSQDLGAGRLAWIPWGITAEVLGLFCLQAVCTELVLMCNLQSQVELVKYNS